MNSKLTNEQKNEILKWKANNEDYSNKNVVEELKFNVHANKRDINISTVKRVLIPEGEVAINFTKCLEANLNDITKEYEIKLSLPLTYMIGDCIYGTFYHRQSFDMKEIRRVKLVNEIVDKAKDLLNKEVISTNDFYGIEGKGDIIHYINKNDKKDWKLINLELFKKHEKNLELNKHTKSTRIIDKDYFELSADDVDSIIKELDINVDTPKGSTKREVVNMFCRHYVNPKSFMYIGYTFEGFEILVTIDASKKDIISIDDVVDTMSIKPTNYWCEYGDSYAVFFEPKMKFHIDGWVDYLKLIISFVDYLEMINKIEGVNIELSPAWFDNLECNYIEISKDLEVRKDIRFTQELFY